MKMMNWKVSIHKHNQLIVKLAVSVLLIVVGFRLLFSQSSEFSDDSESQFIKQAVHPQPAESVDLLGKLDDIARNGNTDSNNPKQRSVSVDLDEERDQVPENGTVKSPVSTDLPENIDPIADNGPESSPDLEKSGNRNQTPKEEEKCDIFTGDWIPTSAGPLYTNETCSLIEAHQNCMKNGRPDTGYFFWRWKPRDCALSQFNAELFLELMRNKSWALIGDSITRNHIQSLLCILSKVEQAILVYHDEEYKSKRWHFPSHNFTISVIWSPFLAKAAIFEDINGVSSADIELHLDKLDPTWTDQYQNLDYMIFSSGKWFIKTAIYHDNNTIIGCHSCPKQNLTELGFNFAYRKVIQKVFDLIISSNHKGIIFYRTSTPDHFENGEWYNGGNCERTGPVKEGEFEMNELNKILRVVELEEFEKAALRASEKGIKLKLFDVMKLSLMRPDGHPGLYRHFHPLTMENTTKIVSDCLHWCLPGPIDTWNDLIMEMVMNG